MSFVSALLSKETAVVLPVLLVLWEALFSGGGADDRRNVVRRHLPFWIVLGVAAAGAWFHPRYALLARESFATRTVSDNLLTEANAAVYALTLFVFPWRLNFDHDLRPVHAITQWPTPLSLAVLAAIVAVAWWTRRRAPRVSLGLGWFLICLLPAHSLLPRYDIVSERNLYLPSVGIYLAVVAAVVAVAGHLGNRRARAAAALTPLLARPYGISRVRTFALAAVLGAIALGLATATVSRNRVYASEVAFWSDAAAKSPHKSRPHNNLGVALLEAGDVDRALDEFRTALALDPHNVTAQDNLRRAWGIRRSR